jgi:hypothetical protein
MLSRSENDQAAAERKTVSIGSAALRIPSTPHIR